MRRPVKAKNTGNMVVPITLSTRSAIVAAQAGRARHDDAGEKRAEERVYAGHLRRQRRGEGEEERQADGFHRDAQPLPPSGGDSTTAATTARAVTSAAATAAPPAGSARTCLRLARSNHRQKPRQQTPRHHVVDRGAGERHHPMRVCSRPRSSRMRASTGNAVMLIAVPRKSTNGSRAAPAAGELADRARRQGHSPSRTAARCSCS